MSGSNQIYLNQTERYSKQNGVVRFLCTTPQLTNVVEELGFEANIIESADLVSLSPPGRIIVNKTGMYNFQIKFDLQDSLDPINNDIEPVILAWYHNRNNEDLLMSSYSERLKANEGFTGENNRRITIGFTTYMSKDEYVYIEGKSAAGTNININATAMDINSWY